MSTNVQPIRVLHCPMNVGANPQGLAQAERALGLKSTAIVYEQFYTQYPVDEVLISFDDNRIVREIKRWRLLWRALRDFDMVHFNFGQAILPMHGGERTGKYTAFAHKAYDFYLRLIYARDLQLLKRAGKGIAVTYQGTDARQNDFCRENFEITFANAVDTGYHSPKFDKAKRRNVATFDRYADRIYTLNPDLCHVLPQRAEFLPYSMLDLDEWQPAYLDSDLTRPLMVVHAPTHRQVKGTHYITEAVERLRQQDRLDFEFVLVEKMSNAEARRIYQRADLLVDQLLVGWYGGLSVELMALGKPSICYLREGDLRFVPDAMRADMPIINATPETIYGVLKDYLTTRRHELPDIGRLGRAYVEKWHDPLKIAARLKKDYEDILEEKQRDK